jgi:hypothetical protein
MPFVGIRGVYIIPVSTSHMYRMSDICESSFFNHPIKMAEAH